MCYRLWFPRVSYCDSDVFRRKTPKSHFRSCLYVVSGVSFGRGTSHFPFGVCLGLIADVIPYSFWVDPWSRPLNGSRKQDSIAATALGRILMC
jgi:hypothetical protein